MDKIKIEYPDIQPINIDQVQYLTQIEKTHSDNVIIDLIEYNKQFLVRKSIKNQHLQTEIQIEHLQNEINALKELNFPSINKIKGISQDNDFIHLFLYFEKGIPLHKLIRNTGKINEKFSTFFFLQLIFTFQYLHQEGWIYRDLKASNVIITNEFQVKLIDFGLAKKIMKQRTSSFCGTKHALPPEIYIKQGYEYDYFLDIYTLGIIYYEMLIGLPPFGLQEEGLIDKIKKGINEEQLKKIENKYIQELLKMMLNQNPDLRPNCNEVLQFKCFENLNIQEIKSFIFDPDKRPKQYQSDYYDEEIYLYCTQFQFDDSDNENINI